MSKNVHEWIRERIDDEPDLTVEVGLLVLAALEGDVALDNYLDFGVGDDQERTPPAAPARPASGAFLKEVTVTSFRGIGPATRLTLKPTPGLTVVAGRNGSGKSSLAEGLEVSLTGDTYRWRNKKAKQWTECWSNLHHDGAPEISVELIEEGSGPLWLHTCWPTGASATEHTTTAQRTIGGRKGPQEDVTTLGWGPALETYRPLLSYDELGGLLEAGPSQLYDAIARVLGTQQLADAAARIKARLGPLSKTDKDVVAQRKALSARLATLADERAHAAEALLKKRSVNVDAVRAVATGSSQHDSGELSALVHLSQATAPDPDGVSSAAARLGRAMETMARAGDLALSRREQRLKVRREALTLYREHGEQTCPVCAEGNLDATWADSAEARIAAEAADLRELADARQEVHDAEQALLAHTPARPAWTDRAPIPELDEPLAAVRTAWDAFSPAHSSGLERASQAESNLETLVSAVEKLREAATAAVTERNDAWTPVAAELGAWCADEGAAAAARPTIKLLQAAEKWLKDNDTQLKNERLRPISERARRAWSLLRQESNVDLGELRLEGQATRRRLSITAAVDGTETESALPVMSQGELHALALALFLPRACLDESPFRFVVLDDPVQAMDPAKVDGLVELLAELAETRQVIVFSHDDRLAETVRRRGVSAEILEVTRGPESVVEVSNAQDPASRYLDDARALLKDGGVPDDTLRRTLTGILRMAVEAAARERFYARRLGRGDSLANVEEAWQGAHKTGSRVSLAVNDTDSSLDTWLTTESRRKGLGIASSGFHGDLRVSPADAVHHVRRLVDDIRTGAR